MMIETADLVKLFVAYGVLMTIGVLYDRYKKRGDPRPNERLRHDPEILD